VRWSLVAIALNLSDGVPPARVGYCSVVAAHDVFSALADPTRREVIEALAQRGGATATELASEMPVTRQAIAKHLGHLNRKGIVTPQRRGRETRYRLTTTPLGQAITWLDEVCDKAHRDD
jgi:DNA-binding transcriptional ArsR family regulator